jgi:hypothetical protein
MGEIDKLPPCRRCGKELKEVPSREAIIPLEVVLRALPRDIHPSSLRHFECPDRHGGVVLIPKMSDDERERAIKAHKQSVVN